MAINSVTKASARRLSSLTSGIATVGATAGAGAERGALARLAGDVVFLATADLAAFFGRLAVAREVRAAIVDLSRCSEWQSSARRLAEHGELILS
jgi:uncharacterized protein (UPF0254 family)